MAFDFPDPSVSKNVTNPLTGASYQWYDDPGKWVLVRANVTSKEAFTRFYAAEDPAAYDETVDGTCALIATGTTIDTITGIKLSEDDLKGKVRYLYEAGEKVVIEDGRNGAYALLEITTVNGDGDYDVKLDKANGQSDIDLTEIYAFGVLQAETTFRGAILDSTEPTEHPDFVAPDNALILGDLWYDTTDAAEYIPYVFDGSTWVLVSADRMPIVSGSAPTEHPKFPGQPLVEGDLWLDNSSGGQMAIYAWDETNNSWTAVGDAGRPPIFSPTEPTEHPDFSPPDNQLQIGDEWYDTSNPDEIVQHIYDGTDWLAIGGDYVHRKGGDSMQGPLTITGERNADPNTGVQSLIKVLNVDSGQNSSLQLKHNGTAKIYIGSGQTSFQHDIKFAQDNKQVYSGSDTDKKGLSFHSDGVEYHGNYTKDDHVATKKDVEEAVFDDPTNPDSNKYVDRTGDTMTGDLTLDDSIVRFENRGDGEPMIRAYRQDGEYPMLMDLRHPGGANNGGYDIKIQGNTSYNSLRFVGADTYLSILAGGGAPYKVRFHTDISMEGSKIAKLAEATDDTDAVPYGQIKTELQEKFEEITATLSFGDFSFVATSAARGLGVLTSFTTASSTTVERDPASVGSLGVHHVAGDGSAVGWDSLNPGDIIRWTRGTDVWQFRVNGAPQPEDSGDELWYRIPVNQGSGPNFVDSGIGNFDYTLSLLKLTGGSADLTDYVKKAGDTMTGELKIQQGSEAKLTLQGNRNNITNSVATVSFLNTSASGQAGYLTYRSDGTNSPYFKFNENLDLNSKQIKNLSSVNFGNVGTIKANDNQKIVIRNAGNGNQGNANVQIERPPSGRRGFAIRGQTPDGGDDTDIFWSYTNASDGDAVNYEGKMSNPTNILNRKEIERLIAAANSGGDGGASGETFISHGPWHFAGVNSAVGVGQFTSNNTGLKQIRQFTFHNKNKNGEDNTWSDLQPGEVITIVQQGDFSSVGGDADGWAIVNYEVTEVDSFSSATILNVSAHWSVLVFSSGFVQYIPNENFSFLEDTDTYVLESQPATLNNIVQMAKKTSAGPAYSVYKLSSSTSEPFLGMPKGTFVCNGNIQTPTKFIFSGDDHYGNGQKWGSNTINCPNSILELYRKNADGTLCLCRIYRFNDIQHYSTGAKFEVRNITPMYTATGGTADIPSPGNMLAGANYLCRFKYSFGTSTVDVPYTIDTEDDTHWGFHRLEDVGEPVDGTDAATKNYVDEAIASLSGGSIKSNVLTWQTSGALTFAHWQFEGYNSSNYTDEGVSKINISKINSQGLPVWTADDFVVGSEFRIQNVDNDDFLEGNIISVVDGGPSSVQVTITRGNSQGSAVGDQTMTVTVDGAEGEPEGQLPYVIDAEGDTHWFDKRLEDVGHPVAVTDAATKGYVDANFLNKTGGTVSGALTVNGAINVGSSLAINGSKRIDFDGSGGTLYGSFSSQALYWGSIGTRLENKLNLNNQKVFNALDPEDPQDVATKKYVDDNSGSSKINVVGSNPSSPQKGDMWFNTNTNTLVVKIN